MGLCRQNLNKLHLFTELRQASSAVGQLGAPLTTVTPSLSPGEEIKASRVERIKAGL